MPHEAKALCLSKASLRENGYFRKARLVSRWGANKEEGYVFDAGGPVHLKPCWQGQCGAWGLWHLLEG